MVQAGVRVCAQSEDPEREGPGAHYSRQVAVRRCDHPQRVDQDSHAGQVVGFQVDQVWGRNASRVVWVKGQSDWKERHRQEMPRFFFFFLFSGITRKHKGK